MQSCMNQMKISHPNLINFSKSCLWITLIKLRLKVFRSILSFLNETLKSLEQHEWQKWNATKLDIKILKVLMYHIVIHVCTFGNGIRKRNFLTLAFEIQVSRWLNFWIKITLTYSLTSWKSWRNFFTKTTRLSGKSKGKTLQVCPECAAKN